MQGMLRIISIAVLLSTNSLAWAQDEEVIPVYQLEVIVFQHLYSDEAAEDVHQVSDYRSVTRPLPIPEDPEPESGLTGNTGEFANTGAQDDASGSAVMPGTILPGFFDDNEFATEPPPQDPLEDPIYETTGLSAAMQTAWNRLQRSPAHEPLHYAGWQQHAFPPEMQKPIRLHDEVALVEPAADQESADFTDESFNEEQDAAVEPDVAGAFVSGDESLPTEPLEGDGPELVEAEEIDAAEFTNYRLDGQLSLVQRKFLHLDIDIEWREAILLSAPDPDEEIEPGPAYRLHTVLQRRQILTDRLEYFDTPVLGIIALITEIEPPEEPEESDTDEPEAAVSEADQEQSADIP
jgi:hypothetical protein